MRTDAGRVHARFAVLVAAVSVAYVLGTPAVHSALLVLSSAGATAVVLARLLRRRLARTLPWWFVATGLAALTVYNAAWFLQVHLAGMEPSEVADGVVRAVGMPVGYVCLLVASVLIVTPIARRDSGGVIDAALVAVGCSVVLWSAVVFPALESAGTAPGRRAYDLLIILMVGGIAGAVVRALVSGRAARGSLAYLLLAVLLTLVGNLATMVAADPVTLRGPSWLSLVWVVGYMAMAGAAAHPAAGVLGTTGRPWEGRLSNRRLFFLGVALAINPVVAAVRALTGREADWLLLSLGSLTVVPLVLLRVAQLARLHADAERRLEHLADHDALTGLPNRRAVDRHVEAVLSRVHRGAAPGAAVLFLDLDDFKEVNDTLGHRVGDDLLVAVATRLRGCVRADGDDLVARFGGDEFVLVLEGDPERLAPRAVARVEAALAEPVTVGAHVLPARASVGVATVGPGDGTTVDHLLSAADARMYERKRAGRARDARQAAGVTPTRSSPGACS
ncbi:GGDEF domain-containing protein [Actinotalea sp. AC32]|nr:GGDEF domain-containing protein [Actinotalea sp. AC32]